MNGLASFGDDLRMSRKVGTLTGKEIIKRFLPDCIRVEECARRDDRNGIDFLAVIAEDVAFKIDQKTRRGGAAQFWKNGIPEIALELWSDRERKVPGWTKDYTKQTDYILQTYDPSDWVYAYLLPFQLLRMGFAEQEQRWTRLYKTAIQSNHGWQSECVFVPINVVMRECRRQMVREP